ncbi:MAG: ATP-binding protein [Candidatus Eisenbacteria bacterium]|nr:ATP-binding protein [Candidatus Eisenbacteria bacterium]
MLELAEIYLLETRHFKPQIERALAAKGALVTACHSPADFPPPGDPRWTGVTVVVDLEEAGPAGIAALQTACRCVVLTGRPSSGREVLERAAAAGWEALIKPYTPDELCFRLSRLWSDNLIWEPIFASKPGDGFHHTIVEAARRLIGCRYARLSEVRRGALVTLADTGDLSGAALVDRVAGTARSAREMISAQGPVLLKERLPSAEFEHTPHGGDVLVVPLGRSGPTLRLFLVHGLEGAPFGAREQQRVTALSMLIDALLSGAGSAGSKRIVSKLLAHVPSGIMVLDTEGRVFSINRHGTAVLSLTDADTVGRHAAEILGLKRDDALSRAIRTGESVMRMEQRVRLPSGKSIVLGVSAAPIEPDDDVERGSILVFQDLSGVKRLEERVRRADQLASLGAMAAGMAHEIRNPLASVLAGVQILGSLLSGDPRAKRHTDTIVQQITRVNGIVQDLLTLGRPARPRIEPCAIDRPIMQAVQGLGTRASDKAVKVNIELPTPAPLAMMDDAQVQQVFLNLLLNGVESMPNGGVLVVRAVERADAASVRVEVVDTGEGIPPENLPQVFTPFFSTKAQGSGLGLSVCNRIISDHGGQMEIASTVGKGTTVVIELPSPRASSSAADLDAGAGSASRRARRNNSPGGLEL